jgi:hypothetical protein
MLPATTPIRRNVRRPAEAAPTENASMTDPRNVAHDKKVQQEKKNHGEEIAPGAIHAPQPGQKPALKHEDDGKESDDNGFST